MRGGRKLKATRPSWCRLAYFLAILVLAFTQYSSVAAALSPDQKKVFQEGIYYYNVDTCDTSGASADVNISGQTTGPAKAVQKVVWDTLTGGGIDPIHAAAVMGNVAHEGAWDPTNIEDPAGQTKDRDVIKGLAGQTQGYGLMGWTPGNKLLATMQELGIGSDKPYTAETQAAVILGQIQGKTSYYDPSVGRQFLATNTVEDATKFYEGGDGFGFERPLDPGATQQDRIDSAKQFLQEFGGESGPATTPSTSSCCPNGSTGLATTGGSISPNVGKGMSSPAQQKFQQILVTAGQKFDVNPNFIASFYYAENARTGDSTNNADSATPPPVTGDGSWREPAAPYGRGDPYGTSTASANGPFQFIPSTWTAYEQDGNGDGEKEVTNLADAAFGAAKYIAASGGKSTASNEQLKQAAHAYNHSDTYVQSVMNTYNYLQGGGSTSVSAAAGDCSSGSTTPGTVDAAVTAAKLLSSYKVGYVWGGLHTSGALDITEPSRLRQTGADCSGSVSWVLHQAGMFDGNAGIVSGDFGEWGQAGEGKEMTIWENADHVFIEFNVPGLGHYELNTSYNPAVVAPDGIPSGTPDASGPGPRFFKATPDASYYSDPTGFTPRHWPGT